MNNKKKAISWVCWLLGGLVLLPLMGGRCGGASENEQQQLQQSVSDCSQLDVAACKLNALCRVLKNVDGSTEQCFDATPKEMGCDGLLKDACAFAKTGYFPTGDSCLFLESEEKDASGKKISGCMKVASECAEHTSKAACRAKGATGNKTCKLDREKCVEDIAAQPVCSGLPENQCKALATVCEYLGTACVPLVRTEKACEEIEASKLGAKMAELYCGLSSYIQAPNGGASPQCGWLPDVTGTKKCHTKVNGCNDINGLTISAEQKMESCGVSGITIAGGNCKWVSKAGALAGEGKCFEPTNMNVACKDVPVDLCNEASAFPGLLATAGLGCVFDGVQCRPKVASCNDTSLDATSCVVSGIADQGACKWQTKVVNDGGPGGQCLLDSTPWPQGCHEVSQGLAMALGNGATEQSTCEQYFGNAGGPGASLVAGGADNQNCAWLDGKCRKPVNTCGEVKATPPVTMKENCMTVGLVLSESCNYLTARLDTSPDLCEAKTEAMPSDCAAISPGAGTVGGDAVDMLAQQKCQRTQTFSGLVQAPLSSGNLTDKCIWISGTAGGAAGRCQQVYKTCSGVGLVGGGISDQTTCEIPNIAEDGERASDGNMYCRWTTKPGILSFVSPLGCYK